MRGLKPIQMALVSNSRLFLEGIQRILKDEGRIEIVASFSNPQDIEECISNIKPEFLFIDNRLFNPEIPKLLDSITGKSPRTRLILFSNRDEPHFPNVIYITKETDSRKLIGIIKGDNQRGYLQPNPVKRVDEKKRKLTKREEKIVELIKSGFSNREIAKKLSISEKTVKAHVSNIFIKMGLQSRYQIMAYTRQRNLNDPLQQKSSMTL